MTDRFEARCAVLTHEPRRWFITGVAGFIGSHLLERLLELGQTVTGIDNFATGKRENLELVRATVGDDAWRRFSFREGDILDGHLLAELTRGADFVLHQAALGSVPRSISAPLETNRVNVDGFLSVAVAARDAKVRRIVYASSSSVYGSDTSLPKQENRIGEQLSPYAASKYTNELYAHTFARAYGLEMAGLRYFNVFGARQDPNGMYAAVIPRWLKGLIAGEQCTIFGDGQTSRDFCFIENVVRANVLAATEPFSEKSPVCNVAVGANTSLVELYDLLASSLEKRGVLSKRPDPIFAPFRDGDIRHSHADISRAASVFGYSPAVRIAEGIERTVAWYVDNLKVR